MRNGHYHLNIYFVICMREYSFLWIVFRMIKPLVIFLCAWIYWLCKIKYSYERNENIWRQITNCHHQLNLQGKFYIQRASIVSLVFSMINSHDLCLWVGDLLLLLRILQWNKLVRFTIVEYHMLLRKCCQLFFHFKLNKSITT